MENRPTPVQIVIKKHPKDKTSKILDLQVVSFHMIHINNFKMFLLNFSGTSHPVMACRRPGHHFGSWTRLHGIINCKASSSRSCSMPSMNVWVTLTFFVKWTTGDGLKKKKTKRVDCGVKRNVKIKNRPEISFQQNRRILLEFKPPQKKKRSFKNGDFKYCKSQSSPSCLSLGCRAPRSSSDGRPLRCLAQSKHRGTQPPQQSLSFTELEIDVISYGWPLNWESNIFWCFLWILASLVKKVIKTDPKNIGSADAFPPLALPGFSSCRWATTSSLDPSSTTSAAQTADWPNLSVFQHLWAILF